MSRTYKDKDFYLRFPEEKYDFGSEKIEYRAVVRTLYEYNLEDDSYSKVEVPQHYIGYRRMGKAGAKTKKSRSYSGDWKWYKQTPSWFVREFMNVPKRAACRNWEKQAIYAVDFEEIEDCPDFGRKPHVYFY